MDSPSESLTPACVLALVSTEKFDPSSSTATPFFLRHAFYRLEEVFSCLLSQDIEALPVHPSYIGGQAKKVV